jgi:hypothetical protein
VTAVLAGSGSDGQSWGQVRLLRVLISNGDYDRPPLPPAQEHEQVHRAHYQESFRLAA